jgi:geranylgeranyl pyrophosphate synthase
VYLLLIHEAIYLLETSNIAILSGDTLFALAYQYAQNADKNTLPQTLSVFNNTAIEVCEGQQFDLNYENNNNVTVDDYLNMIRLKTGVLFGASLKIGALIGGAPQKDADLIYDFGVYIGLGFQLKDDLLDTYGDEKIFGKKTGGDIISNKKTFLYLKALEIADKQTKEELLSLYNSPEINDNYKIKSTKDIFTRLKIDIESNKKIDKYYSMGMECLEKINISQEKKEALKIELIEELNIEPNITDLYLTVVHQYPDFELTMHSFICEANSMSISLNEHISHQWLTKEKLDNLDWAAADLPIVQKLMCNA